MPGVDESAQVRVRLRRIAHAIGIGFAVFTCLAVFIVIGDADLVFALMGAAGLSAGIWLAALWYVEHNQRAR
jgi:hypothetical protein